MTGVRTTRESGGATREARAAPRKRLGVLGTLVLDSVHRPGEAQVKGLWGGVAYSLAAFDHALPAGWTIVPLVKLGADLAESGARCLRSVSRRIDLDCVRTAGERNNRVELRYCAAGRRTERLRGGVPGWSGDEVVELLPSLTALYVNFVSGLELDLDGARRLGKAARVPVYADLHSLFLDVESDGSRSPRPFPEAADFAACFDCVQMNEDEFALFQSGCCDGVAAPDRALRGRAALLAVTRGPEGADLFAATNGRTAPERTHVSSSPARDSGDPTGCGDVWGAVFFARLLAGASPPEAAVQANAAAAANLECSGPLELHAALVRRRPAPAAMPALGAPVAAASLDPSPADPPAADPLAPQPPRAFLAKTVRRPEVRR